MDWNFEYSYTKLPNIYYSYVNLKILKIKITIIQFISSKRSKPKISNKDKEICILY